MRDEVYVRRVGVQTWTYYTKEGEIEKIATYGRKPGYFITGRSDVVKSDHFSATNYRAHRIDINGGRWKDEWWKRSGSTYYRKRVRVGPRTAPHFSRFGVSSTYQPNVPDWVVDKAKAAAIANMQGGNLNLGFALAELPKTVRGLADITTRFARGLSAARKGNFAKMGKIWGISPRGTADNWLSYQYGIKPLVSDLFAAQEGIKNALGKRAGMKLTAKGVATYTDSSSKVGWEYPKRLYGCEVGYSFVIKDSELAGLASLGLTNPLAIAWEVVPLSFVVDWFLPIGQFLEGLSGFHGTEFGTGYQTNFVKVNGKIIDKITHNDYGDTEWRCKIFAMRRWKLTSAPRPGLGFRLAQTSTRAASAAALLAQRV